MKYRKLWAMVFCLIGPIVIWANDTRFDMDVGNPPPCYRVLIKDNPEKLRFDLLIVSCDERPLCVSNGGWPNRLGQVAWGAHWVKLTSNKQDFPARDSNFGYCEGSECTLRIASRGELKGFIGYAEFGDAQEIAHLQNRRLHFETTAYLCDPAQISKPKSAKKGRDKEKMGPH